MRVQWPSLVLLRGHVRWRADRRACARRRMAVQRHGVRRLLGRHRSRPRVGGLGPREPEVHHPHAAVVADHEVGGLEIAVDEPGGVRGRQTRDRGLEHVENLGNRSARFLRPTVERGTLDELHRDPQVSIAFPHVVDRHDVGMCQLGHRLGFAESSIVGHRTRGHDLERDLAIELRVERGVHHPHRAGSHAPDDDIPAHRVAGLQLSGRGRTLPGRRPQQRRFHRGARRGAHAPTSLSRGRRAHPPAARTSHKQTHSGGSNTPSETKVHGAKPLGGVPPQVAMVSIWAPSVRNQAGRAPGDAGAPGIGAGERRGQAALLRVVEGALVAFERHRVDRVPHARGGALDLGRLAAVDVDEHGTERIVVRRTARRRLGGRAGIGAGGRRRARWHSSSWRRRHRLRPGSRARPEPPTPGTNCRAMFIAT